MPSKEFVIDETRRIKEKTVIDSSCIRALLSLPELAAIEAAIARQPSTKDLDLLGWGDTYSPETPEEEGFLNVKDENLRPVHITTVPLSGGRKEINKISAKARKEVQKFVPMPCATVFVMQKVTLFGAYLLSLGYLQYHTTIRFEEEGVKVPLHFWSTGGEGDIVLPKLKISNLAQYQAVVKYGWL